MQFYLNVIYFQKYKLIKLINYSDHSFQLYSTYFTLENQIIELLSFKYYAKC